ncbi:MAG: hypothetical protein QOJ60_256 [Actinomycetota bacterium]|nr:hypothetical protein [Actinomycetota bacterium]
MTTTDARPLGTRDHADPGLPVMSRPTPRRLSRIAAQLAARPDLWWGHVRFDAASRHYARIAAQETYEAWLLTWLPGQATGLHDHGDAFGAFTVLDGVLRETTVTAGARGSEEIVRDLVRGRARSFGAAHLHDVANVGDIPAVSLHVYSPALSVVRRYERSGERMRPVSFETAGVDW